MSEDTTSDVVTYEVSDRIATVTLNRPERLNAWTGAMGNLYWTYLDQAKDDPEVRAIIVTGAGRGFCSGADMDMLQGIGAGRRDDKPARNEHQTYTLSVPKLVVAAINGACAGLGLVQATMADVRFAASNAKFTTAFARRGLIAEHGLGWVLPKLVGPSRALDLLLSGRVILAEEAREMGLVNQVTEPDQLIATVRAYVTDIVENVSPTSIAVMKRQVWTGVQTDLATSNELAEQVMAASLKAADFKEGVASFLEKRKPQFAPISGS